MVQKDDNRVVFEIVLNLIKNGENHIRGLAKDLNTSHTTVLRKVNDLLEESVLDFRIVGKNKSFFLKKTLKTKNYVIMCEAYKTNRFLSVHPEIGINIKDLLSKVDSNLILLFGSYAKGLEKKGSDVDVFIESKDMNIKKVVQDISNKISLKIGSFDVNNLVVKEIIKDHVILKGFEVFYEKIKFFE